MQRLHYAEWGIREWLGAAGAVLRRRARSGPDLDIVHRRLVSITGDRPIHLLNAGRNAIRLALDVFRKAQPKRDRVVVPGYICPSVVDAVLACGLVPVGADIAQDLNIAPDSVIAAIDDRTLAVICPHMYGCPAPIAGIERICRDAGIFLIDDSAQVLGAVLDGRPLGTFGDVGIFSFNQSKAVVTGHRGSGGALVINNPALREGTLAEYARLPVACNWLGPFAHFVWNYQLGPYTGRSGYYFDRLATRVHSGTGFADHYRPATMANFWAAIANPQLERLEAMVSGRIRVAADYHCELAELPEIGFPQFAEGRYLSRIVLTMPTGTDMPSLRAAMAARGVMTRGAYATPEIVGRNAPVAMATAMRLLEVPSHSRMTASEVRSICTAISSCLDLTTSRSPASGNAADADRIQA